MKYLIGVLAAVALLTFAGVSTVAAGHRGAENCTDRADAERAFVMWGEKMVAEKEGRRLYVNPDTGTWTIVSWDDKTDTVCLLQEGQRPAPKL